jgi:hypothetical protein
MSPEELQSRLDKHHEREAATRARFEAARAKSRHTTTDEDRELAARTTQWLNERMS